MNKKRVTIFLCLAFGLFLGIVLNWPMIVRDMGRLEPWKVPFFWIGDVFALLFAFQWMLKRDDESVQDLPKQFQSSIKPKMVVLLIAGAFLFDVAVTGYALWDSKRSMKRAVAATATIESTRKVLWANKAKHFTVVADVNDKQQRKHRVELKFSHKLIEQPQPWLVKAIESTEKGQGGPIEIVYDPTWPQRAWVEGQPWGATSDISGLFAVIHILQTIFVAMGIDDILKSTDSQIRRTADRVRLYPLICEVCLLVIFGLVLSQ